jgi:predicted short-subunit dehydrogenase-like oxidoreductase (DUF2520 family)
MQTIAVLGTGRVGKTLGRLFADSAIVAVTSVFNRLPSNANESVAFIGQGMPVSSLTDLATADYYMLSVADQAIAPMVAALIEQQVQFKQGSVVFHCSGALSSAVLYSLQQFGCRVASVHPIKSFALPSRAVTDFKGTYCGIEGDLLAVEKLQTLFMAIGAIPLRLDSKQKAMYHAATVMACNNLVALMQAAIVMYQQAGLSQQLAYAVARPIVEGTVNNIFSLGTVQSLTGPIARGDVETVKMHLQAITEPQVKQLYTSLGQWALGLARERAEASEENLAQIEQLLRTE